MEIRQDFSNAQTRVRLFTLTLGKLAVFLISLGKCLLRRKPGMIAPDLLTELADLVEAEVTLNSVRATDG
jgi:hypothetical protein